MEIGDWSGTRDLNGLYQEIRELGLETNLAELEAFGFTVLEGALTPDLTDRLRAAVLAEAERRFGRPFDLDREESFEGYSLVPYLLYKDPAFEEALLCRGPLLLLSYLLGRSCLLSSMASHFKGPGGQGILLHSDNGNGAPSPFPPYSQVANCNYALTDYSEEGGCLAVVPGSHRLARQPTAVEVGLDGAGRNPDAIALEIPAGSAVVWHGNTWHGSFARRRPGVRVNLATYFCRQSIQPQESYADEVPAEVWARRKDDSRFVHLIGRRAAYGWKDEGPDMQRLGRAAGAGRSWQA